MKSYGHIGIYGNIMIKRVHCDNCKGMTMVIEGKKQCCDEPAEHYAKGFRVIAQPLGYRKSPPKRIRDKILVLQQERCLYCNRVFGSMYERNGKILFTKLHWDHKVPFAYTQGNAGNNWAASCNICNGIKSDKMFESVGEVRQYVAERRKEKGYNFYEDETKKVL